MAIDSAIRRFSMLDFDTPTQPGMGPPNAAPDAGDRQHLLWLYAFDAGGEPPEPPVASDEILRTYLGMGIHPKHNFDPKPLFTTRH